MSNEPTQSSGYQRPEFEQFLLSEYTNIAEAFFNTVESISSFMKHYIVVASVPPALAVVLLTAPRSTTSDFINVTLSNQWSIGLILLLVTIVGLLVMCYVVNLRCDAILYARTVNGIRGYYFEQAYLSVSARSRLNTLPTTNAKPEYFERWYFIFVIAVFATIGTVYFAVGLHLLLEGTERTLGVLYWPIALLFFALHFLIYWRLAVYREKAYLK